MRPRLPRAVRSLVLILAIGSVARAEDSEGALRRLELGLAEFKSGRFEAARDHYAAAWASWRHYRSAAALGQVELELGRHRDAAEHLSACLSLLPASADTASLRENVQAGLDVAKKHVGALLIQVEGHATDAAAGELVITLDGAAIDGDSVRAREREIFVEPGAHHVRVSAPGVDPVESTVSVEAGQARTVSFSLAKARTTSPGTEPAPGPARAPTPVEPAPPNEGGSARTIVLISGAALATLAAGTWFGFRIASESSESDASNLRRSARLGPSGCAIDAPSAVCADLADSIDSAETSATISNVAGVSALVLGVATGATFFLWKPSNVTRVSAGPRGVVLSSTF